MAGRLENKIGKGKSRAQVVRILKGMTDFRLSLTGSEGLSKVLEQDKQTKNPKNNVVGC